MANHKSALKRIRSNDKKRLRNRFQHKTARNAIRKLRSLTTKKEANKQFPEVVRRRLKRMIAKSIIKIISATLLTITPPLITLKT